MADACFDELEDIEDLDDDPVTRLQHAEVQPKRFQNRTEHEDGHNPLLPGKASIYLKTWGCSHNNSDGEYMAGLLASQGYEITEDRQKADLWLLNSCTVKNPSQDVFLNAVRAGEARGAKVVIAGCVPQGQPNNRDLAGFSTIGVQQIHRVVEVVEETLKGHQVQLLDRKTSVPLNLPKIRKNTLVEIIPINSGCLNQCTYCKTKHARGDLKSYPIQDIIDRAVQVFKEGVVELWLTSEDTGTYGRDIGTSLPELLWRLVAVIPEGCMLRVGMTNPPYILEHLEEMAKIFNHPRVYAFLHVPVQSCADAVLLQMKRKYTCDDFLHVVDFLRERVEGMTIATDVICGFPTETEEHFDKTLEVFQQYKFPVVNISQFYPRPGTPAARMPRVSTGEVKRRSTAMTRLFESYQTFDHMVGLTLQVLVTEMAADRVHMVGHSKNYVQVLLPHRPELMGRMVSAHITGSGKFFLNGEVVDEESSVATTRPRRVLETKQSSSDASGPVGHTDSVTQPEVAECCGGGCKKETVRNPRWLSPAVAASLGVAVVALLYVWT